MLWTWQRRVQFYIGVFMTALNEVRVSEDRFAQACSVRPNGFRSAAEKIVRRDGAEVVIPLKLWGQLTLEWQGKPIGWEEPNALQLGSRALFAAWRAVSAAVAGERVFVTESELEKRKATCDVCEYFESSARLGLGRCNAPGCNCTKFKQWLITEKCPLGKWPA